MSQGDQYPCPVVTRRAGLDADQASRESFEKSENIVASQLQSHDNHAARVDAMNLKDMLGDIQTDGDNPFRGRLSLMWPSTTTLWHCDAGSGGRPPHQVTCAAAISIVKSPTVCGRRV